MIGLFFRGWTMVTLVALNTVQIAQHRYYEAFFVGFLISWVWWKNAHSAGTKGDGLGYGVAYAAGAACGTVTGMWLGGVNL